MLRFRIIISKNPASQDKICLNDKFWSGTVIDFPDENNNLYTYEEILGIIDKYGLPQDWNDDGAHGPERYIEAHIWTDEAINKWLERTSDELLH